MSNANKEIQELIEDWDNDALQVKPIFTALYDFLQKQPDIRFTWKARPGVSYSLRAHKGNTDDFFVLVDIIDEEERWLSACFPARLITDPQEKGDLIPKGMNGEDAICFDIDAAMEPAEVEYMTTRLGEGYKNI